MSLISTNLGQKIDNAMKVYNHFFVKLEEYALLRWVLAGPGRLTWALIFVLVEDELFLEISKNALKLRA